MAWLTWIGCTSRGKPTQCNVTSLYRRPRTITNSIYRSNVHQARNRITALQQGDQSARVPLLNDDDGLTGEVNEDVPLLRTKRYNRVMDNNKPCFINKMLVIFTISFPAALLTIIMG